MSRKITVSLITLVLVIVVAIFIGKYADASARAVRAEAALTERTGSQAALDFTAVFVDKVLRAQGEIGFEDRLMLENGVRALKDTQIMDQWKRFVESSSEAAAQKEVTALLQLLIEKAGASAN